MNAEDSRMAASAICFAADMMKEIFREAVSIWGSPGTVYRPRLYLDGDRWCALYGENLQEGVAGFGMSPAEAMAAFDVAWFSATPERVSDGGPVPAPCRQNSAGDER